ncbi:hypothetical protein GOBAR_AA09293 [Gossypium barbadense]|uniref:Formin-like protein n=1 Tax=Gossypium barbadense TaxID=3634 RepID=A0A2P5Y6X8_GOSBA|nr:hypothetical protein GOBAR_AA09293 [Gossypium barbadense]
MAVMFQTLISLNLLLVFFISVLPFSSSQSSPQNIEVFFPTQTPPPTPQPISQPPPLRPPLPPPSSSSSSGDDDNSTIAKAVAATAGSTIVIAAVFFFCIRRYVLAQRKSERVGDSSQGGQPRVPPDEFARVNGNIKGLIVDENGLDVLYWRQLQNGDNKIEFRQEVLHVPKDEEEGGGGMVRKGSRSKKRDKSSMSKPGESSGDGENNQVKLKPLHWDKVNKKNADHSMVWDKINGGSFKFDDDLMEALFGYVATNRKSPTGDSSSKNTKSVNNGSPSQIMVLDARKSQNIAIVLKSLALSRRELLDALNEGQGLEADTLEKLMRIAPTEEEQSQILDFDGDPTRLADADSFLFHILKALPSAFTRLNAMQFRSNYDLEILHMKESLQALELGCKELRSQRLFLKLLEAILKAGNRMNAGTARGNAQAFNLTSLLKLSDVKSTDGKTTLLHFVVEEVVRSEGKKCFISRMVGGLSAEFTNVKKAAAIDFKIFSGTCSALAARVAEIKQLVLHCMADGKGGFVQEMKGFINDAEEELKVIREEQKRVMDVVKRTTEYYQAEASKDPFQVFVIVKDFLAMVDQVCVEIARNQQRRKSSTANYGSQSPNSQESRTKMRFPVLPANFMADKSRSNSVNSDADS